MGRLSHGARRAAYSAVERSDLIVRMAPHVSRFVASLFGVDAAPPAIRRRAPQQLDALFRFKVDFVRKRALPLVKGGAHVPLDPADVAVVERAGAPVRRTLDHELAIAMAGCALLDREAAAAPPAPRTRRRRSPRRSTR